MWLYEKSIIDQTKFTIVLRICSLFLQHELIKYIHKLSFYLLIIAVNVARSQLMLLWILGKCGRNYGRFWGDDPPAQPYFPIHQFSVCLIVIDTSPSLQTWICSLVNSSRLLLILSGTVLSSPAGSFAWRKTKGNRSIQTSTDTSHKTWLVSLYNARNFWYWNYIVEFCLEIAIS